MARFCWTLFTINKSNSHKISLDQSFDSFELRQRNFFKHKHSRSFSIDFLLLGVLRPNLYLTYCANDEEPCSPKAVILSTCISELQGSHAVSLLLTVLRLFILSFRVAFISFVESLYSVCV